MRTIPALLVGSLLAVACAPEEAQPEKPTSLRLAVTMSSTPEQVASVKLTATSPRDTYTFDLVAAGDHWSGGGPVRPNDYYVQAQAFDAAGTLLYEGGAGPYTVTFGATTLVTVLAQSAQPPISFGNTPPRISALYVSTLEPALNEEVRLIVAAFDRDPGSVLTYAWTATDGAFADAAAPRTTWTAPAYDSIPSLTVTVTDEKGASSQATFTLMAGNPTGDVAADVYFNSPPDVLYIEASATQVDAYQEVTFWAQASDADGDSLSYGWSFSCPGYFYSDGASATFMPYGLPVGTVCDAYVYAWDPRGGSNVGWTSFWIGPPPPPKVLPKEIVNGSFETGDYTGWTVLQAYGSPWDMTQGIGARGETVWYGSSVYDFADQMWPTQYSPGLPITFAPSDGERLAFVLVNGPTRGRLYQELEIPAGATTLAWDMAYTNHAGTFVSREQAVSVRLIDFVTGTSVADVYTSLEGAPMAIPMTSFTADVSAFTGQALRLNVNVHALLGPFDVMLDNFRIY